jgi:hypothetical protein
MSIRKKPKQPSTLAERLTWDGGVVKGGQEQGA